ncbi:MAG: hypothetical protein QF721_03215 [Verrucomicrobiota bacterium]|nr:hypothetical protein [Verrucomicrobiota bacterium]MDP7048438.1 hypothetical protein [Verrucomicrobiota bacterium]
MKKLLILFAIVGMIFSAQAQVSLADRIAEAGTDWLIGSWQAETDDGTALTLAYSWVIKDRVVAARFKSSDNESYSLIAVNPDTDEIEQVGYDSRGRKSKGTWGPKDEMPMVKLESKSDSGEIRGYAVAFRKIDQNNIEAQIFQVDASGNVGDFSDLSLEFKRKQAKK